MKNACSIFALMLMMTSCDWLDLGSKSEDSGSIGGSTNIPVNTLGNTFTNKLPIGGSIYSGSISITNITDGVATINFKAPIPSSYPVLQNIKSKYKDASGNLTCEGKFKMTDEGVMDYNNKEHKPFVLVKYDAKVGDKYTLERSDGTTLVREVVSVSSTNDFPWNGMLIKTINVEQKTNIPGVKKLVYYANHKFGIVAVQAYLEDGSTPRMELVSSK